LQLGQHLRILVAQITHRLLHGALGQLPKVVCANSRPQLGVDVLPIARHGRFKLEHDRSSVTAVCDALTADFSESTKACLAFWASSRPSASTNFATWAESRLRGILDVGLTPNPLPF
jgi:hypothetical protein